MGLTMRDELEMSTSRQVICLIVACAIALVLASVPPATEPVSAAFLDAGVILRRPGTGSRRSDDHNRVLDERRANQGTEIVVCEMEPSSV
jgi:hypothetical protein